MIANKGISRNMSMAVKKGRHFGAQVVPLLLRLLNEPFPLSGKGCSERPGAVRGAPLLGAAKRTLDGEDRSKMIEKRERRGEGLTKGGGAKMAPLPGATDTKQYKRAKILGISFGHASGTNPWP
jgi:hypothetical protein